MSIYTVVKNIANKQGKSIYRIEHDCGISNGTIGRWDRAMPSAGNLQTVADYLGVTSAYILNQAKKGE